MATERRSSRFLTRQLVTAALVGNAIRPPRNPWMGAVSMMPGWLASELAPHLLAVTAADALVSSRRAGSAGKRRLGLALAAANKRIVNILKKADGVLGEPDVALLAEDAEKALFHAIVEVAPLARSHFQNEDYTDALRVLAGLRAAVDRFFDEVMVMAEEPLVRQNRLALLGQLAGLMNQVADISRLSA